MMREAINQPGRRRRKYPGHHARLDLRVLRQLFTRCFSMARASTRFTQYRAGSLAAARSEVSTPNDGLLQKAGAHLHAPVGIGMLIMKECWPHLIAENGCHSSYALAPLVALHVGLLLAGCMMAAVSRQWPGRRRSRSRGTRQVASGRSCTAESAGSRSAPRPDRCRRRCPCRRSSRIVRGRRTGRSAG